MTIDDTAMPRDTAAPDGTGSPATAVAAVADPLLPPRRVGRALAQARVIAGLSREQVALALGGRLGEDDLLDVEAGRRALADEELAALARCYGVEVSTVVPSRGELVVDLTEGVLDAGGRRVDLAPAAGGREVLERYLALVYAMRDAQPGTTVPLRFDDVSVLARVLDRDHVDVERDLLELMATASAPVRDRMRRLRGRVLLPMAGVVVAVTAAGTLLLVPPTDSGAAPAPRVDAVATTSTVAPAATTAPADPAAVPVEIGDAVVQERGPDGSAGPVQVRD